MAFCVSLQSELSVGLVGGKASALSKMIRLGLPIPTGFCVTTEAYRAHIAQLNVNFRDDRAVYQAILNAPVLPKFEEAFRRLWDEYEWVDTLSLVAVRSSATAEDLDTASFAGQYESYLNIDSIAEALEKVKRCWASAWSYHARAYAKKQNLSENIEMAVVIQEMALADVAGVAFSAEPITGERDVIYLEGVSGLGEPLVSGQKAPDLKAWISHSDHILRTDVLSAEIPSVLLGSLTDLAVLIIKIEQLFGVPQDIEWVWKAKGGFSIIQARPVVNLPPLLEQNEPRPWMLPGIPKGGWTDDQHFVFDFWDEYNAKYILPLDWDLYDRAAWETNLRMFDYLDGVPHVENIAVMLDGVVIGLDPAGRQQNEAEITRVKMEPIDNWEATMQYWEHSVAALLSEAIDLTAIETNKLISLIERTAAAFEAAFCSRMASMGQWISPGDDSDPVDVWENRIKSLLASVLPDEEIEEALIDLESGIEHETALMNKALWELKSTAVSRQQTSKSPALQKRVEQFLKRFGHFQANNAPLATNPEYLWAQINSALESDEAGPDPELIAKQRFEKRLGQLERILTLSQWQQLQEAAHQARYWTKMREDSKTKQNLAFPLLERLVQEAGSRLYQYGLIHDENQVKLLRWREVREALLVPTTATSLADKTQRRKRLVNWKENYSWLPQGFLGEEISPDQFLLQGESGSPGITQGPAKLVRGPEDFKLVQAGDIVIAYTTNPVWTQIFGRIVGIVVERGGRTSHAAVVAREYSIPAVLGILGVFSIIRNGEQLLVDGNLGEVKRLDLLPIQQDNES